MVSAIHTFPSDAPRQVTTPAGSVTTCACGGSPAPRSGGTKFCCEQGELKALRAFRAEVERQVSFELECPPSDAHAARFLSWVYRRAVSMKASPF